MARFAVIDTETNWNDQVMSIGTVIADSDGFRLLAGRYHIITPEYQVGGMFADTLFLDCGRKPIICTREQAMADLSLWLAKYSVENIFAYNARFDRTHLPELGYLNWYDIMRLAAYRQYNPMLPRTADYCSTGRLRRGFGVEPMLHMLSGDCGYRESHNALGDALDELEIMRLLGHPLSAYIPL